MFKLFVSLVFLCFIGTIGGFIFVATWDMPRPAKQVEKVIPNEQFFAEK